MIHPIDLMTEKESNELLTKCLNAVKAVVPASTAFIVIVEPFGDRDGDRVGGLYGSNTQPRDAVRLMRETAARIEYRQKKGT
jgi:hypothetical protein